MRYLVAIVLFLYSYEGHATVINSADEARCRVATAQRFQRGMGKEPENVKFSSAEPGVVAWLPKGFTNVEPSKIMAAIDSREDLFGFTAIERVRNLEAVGQLTQARETAGEIVRQRIGPVIWLTGTLAAKVAGETTQWSVRCPLREGRALDLWVEIGH